LSLCEFPQGVETDFISFLLKILDAVVLATFLKLIRFLHPQHYSTLFVSQWF